MAVSCGYRAFRMVGDASMVLSLQRLDCVEDKHLLAGHLIVLQDGDYDTAQVCGREGWWCHASAPRCAAPWP